MKVSELCLAISEEFGDVYGGVLLRDHWLRMLSSTGEQALESGVRPRDVWEALCEEFGIPKGRRHGRGMREPRK